MKIIKLLKKKIAGILKEKPKANQEKISFEDIEKYLFSNEEKIQKNLSDAIKLIHENITSLTHETNDKLDTLSKVSLDKKNEDERIKHLVLTNKQIYTKEVEKLLSELKHLKSHDFNDFISQINLNFFEFKKRSDDKYKKSTFLIGKEIADVSECISKFMKNYSKIVSENEGNMQQLKLISEIRAKLRKIELSKSEKKVIEETIHKITSEIKSLKQKIKDVISEIEKVKNSREHKENLDNIEKQKTLILEINKELNELKLMIDFKTLTEMFHSSEKYRPIVKNFRENFNEHFKEDNGVALLHIISEAKINNEAIRNKITDINSKSEEFYKIKSLILHDKVQSSTYELKKLESELNTLNDAKEKESKRIDKLKSAVDDIKSSIKTDFLKFDVIVE